jgi:anti-sigma B factor antagonist
MGTDTLSHRDKGVLMSLTIDLDQYPTYWTLTLKGDLDYGECAGFRMNIDRILKSAPHAAIVDLRGLEYLDSSGLGLLLSLSKEYGAEGGKLVLVTNETVDNILTLTRLSGIFTTSASMDEALAIIDANSPATATVPPTE